MPFYDLKCTSCYGEHNISASMKEKSEKLIACPDCGSFELETVFRAPPAFVRGVSAPAVGCPNRSSACGSGCPHAG